MELHGSHLGSLGFSRTEIYESLLMCFKDAICIRKILLKMALDTVLDGGDGELAHVPVHGFWPPHRQTSDTSGVDNPE
jgi:hypothetical protein